MSVISDSELEDEAMDSSSSSSEDDNPKFSSRVFERPSVTCSDITSSTESLEADLPNLNMSPTKQSLTSVTDLRPSPLQIHSHANLYETGGQWSFECEELQDHAAYDFGRWLPDEHENFSLCEASTANSDLDKRSLSVSEDNHKPKTLNSDLDKRSLSVSEDNHKPKTLNSDLDKRSLSVSEDNHKPKTLNSDLDKRSLSVSEDNHKPKALNSDLDKHSFPDCEDKKKPNTSLNPNPQAIFNMLDNKSDINILHRNLNTSHIQVTDGHSTAISTSKEYPDIGKHFDKSAFAHELSYSWQTASELASTLKLMDSKHICIPDMDVMESDSKMQSPNPVGQDHSENESHSKHIEWGSVLSLLQSDDTDVTEWNFINSNKRSHDKNFEINNNRICLECSSNKNHDCCKNSATSLDNKLLSLSSLSSGYKGDLIGSNPTTSLDNKLLSSSAYQGNLIGSINPTTSLDNQLTTSSAASHSDHQKSCHIPTGPMEDAFYHNRVPSRCHISVTEPESNTTHTVDKNSSALLHPSLKYLSSSQNLTPCSTGVAGAKDVLQENSSRIGIDCATVSPRRAIKRHWQIDNNSNSTYHTESSMKTQCFNSDYQSPVPLPQTVVSSQSLAPQCHNPYKTAVPIHRTNVSSTSSTSKALSSVKPVIPFYFGSTPGSVSLPTANKCNPDGFNIPSISSFDIQNRLYSLKRTHDGQLSLQYHLDDPFVQRHNYRPIAAKVSDIQQMILVMNQTQPVCRDFNTKDCVPITIHNRSYMCTKQALTNRTVRDLLDTASLLPGGVSSDSEDSDMDVTSEGTDDYTEPVLNRTLVYSSDMDHALSNNSGQDSSVHPAAESVRVATSHIEPRSINTADNSQTVLVDTSSESEATISEIDSSEGSQTVSITDNGEGGKPMHTGVNSVEHQSFNTTVSQGMQSVYSVVGSWPVNGTPTGSCEETQPVQTVIISVEEPHSFHKEMDNSRSTDGNSLYVDIKEQPGVDETEISVGKLPPLPTEDSQSQPESLGDHQEGSSDICDTSMLTQSMHNQHKSTLETSVMLLEQGKTEYLSVDDIQKQHGGKLSHDVNNLESAVCVSDAVYLKPGHTTPNVIVMDTAGNKTKHCGTLSNVSIVNSFLMSYTGEYISTDATNCENVCSQAHPLDLRVAHQSASPTVLSQSHVLDQCADKSSDNSSSRFICRQADSVWDLDCSSSSVSNVYPDHVSPSLPNLNHESLNSSTNSTADDPYTYLTSLHHDGSIGAYVSPNTLLSSIQQNSPVGILSMSVTNPSPTALVSPSVRNPKEIAAPADIAKSSYLNSITHEQLNNIDVLNLNYPSYLSNQLVHRLVKAGSGNFVNQMGEGIRQTPQQVFQYPCVESFQKMTSERSLHRLASSASSQNCPSPNFSTTTSNPPVPPGCLMYQCSENDVKMVQSIKNAHRSREDKLKPRHFLISELRIGNYKFSCSGIEGDRTSKIKIIFSRRKLVYELQVNEAPSLLSTCIKELATVEIAFESIIHLWGHDKHLVFELSEEPLMFLGTRVCDSSRPRLHFSHMACYDRSKTVDITGGYLSIAPYHFITLRSSSVDKVKHCFAEFSDKFCEMLLRPLVVNPHKQMKKAAQRQDVTRSTSQTQNGHQLVDADDNNNKITAGEKGCGCASGCRSKMCRCRKQGTLCSDQCCCCNCENPLNVLHKMGVAVDMACLDACLMQNIYQVMQLEEVLKRQLVLQCCHLAVPLKECVPGLVSCPNKPQCTASYRFSWCKGELCNENSHKRNHCHLCQKCVQPRNQHCQCCNTCYYQGPDDTACPVCKTPAYAPKLKICLEQYERPDP